MAVTRILNIKKTQKEEKKLGSAHLIHAFHYILKKEKTEDGKWIGGNSGVEPDEVYQTMLDTKEDWGKPDGRQGYHFIISWKAGETEIQTAYNVIKEFCQEYLGDNYDYVFSVHNDKAHIHGHIIFNSVNRVSGYKYRYVKGDWEKHIQPVTDRICVRHGLKPLTYDKERKGRSYAQWEAEKNGTPDWKKIIRADIDATIRESENEETFFAYMERQGYEMKRGKLREHGTYIAFRAPGQGRAWRSNKLGAGYTYADIMERIRTREKYHYHKQMPRVKAAKFSGGNRIETFSSFQILHLKKWYLISYRHRFLKNPYAIDQAAVRKNLLHIDRLAQECRYLMSENIRSPKQLRERKELLLRKEKELKNQKYSTEFLQDDEQMTRYRELAARLKEIPESDDRFEEVLDEMEELERELPDEAFQAEEMQREVSEQLSQLRGELRTIRHIEKNLEETKQFAAAWSSAKGKEKEKSVSERFLEKPGEWFRKP